MSFTAAYYSTYRGCDISRRNAGTASDIRWVYSSDCISGWYYKISAVTKRIDISLLEPEAVPVSDIWVNHSTYQGITIESMYDAGAGRTSYRAFLDNKWWSSTSLSTVQGYIDNYLRPEPEPEPEPVPEPEPKKPTELTIEVHPRSGAPPYQAVITSELISDGTLVPFKPIKLYKNDVVVATKNTNLGGVAEFIETIIDDADYYTYFAGDSVYEGCPAPGVM